MNLTMTDQSVSMEGLRNWVSVECSVGPGHLRPGLGRGSAVAAEPLGIDRVIATVFAHLGQCFVHRSDQFAALGKADAVLMRHLLVAHGLHVPATGGGDIVKHV